MLEYENVCALHIRPPFPYIKRIVIKARPFRSRPVQWSRQSSRAWWKSVKPGFHNVASSRSSQFDAQLRNPGFHNLVPNCGIPLFTIWYQIASQFGTKLRHNLVPNCEILVSQRCEMWFPQRCEMRLSQFDTKLRNSGFHNLIPNCVTILYQIASQFGTKLWSPGLDTQVFVSLCGFHNLIPNCVTIWYQIASQFGTKLRHNLVRNCGILVFTTL